ncbi:MAG: hypothetical protein ACLSAF_21245 [Intestinimonas sp.]
MVGGQGHGAQLGHHKGHGDLAQVDGGALRDMGTPKWAACRMMALSG